MYGPEVHQFSSVGSDSRKQNQFETHLQTGLLPGNGNCNANKQSDGSWKTNSVYKTGQGGNPDLWNLETFLSAAIISTPVSSFFHFFIST